MLHFVEEAWNDGRILPHRLQECRIAGYQEPALTAFGFEYGRQELVEGSLDFVRMFHPCHLGAILRAKPKPCGQCEKKRDAGSLRRVVANELPNVGSRSVGHRKTGVTQRQRLQPIGQSNTPKSTETAIRRGGQVLANSRRAAYHHLTNLKYSTKKVMEVVGVK
jgi:hypothetical protein